MDKTLTFATLLILMTCAFAGNTVLWPNNALGNMSYTKDIYGNKLVDIYNNNTATWLCTRETIETGTSTKTGAFSQGYKVSVQNQTFATIETAPGINQFYCTDNALSTQITPRYNLVGYSKQPIIILIWVAAALYLIITLTHPRTIPELLGLILICGIMPLLIYPESAIAGFSIWLMAITAMDVVARQILQMIQPRKTGRLF